MKTAGRWEIFYLFNHLEVTSFRRLGIQDFFLQNIITKRDIWKCLARVHLWYCEIATCTLKFWSDHTTDAVWCRRHNARTVNKDLKRTWYFEFYRCRYFKGKRFIEAFERAQSEFFLKWRCYNRNKRGRKVYKRTGNWLSLKWPQEYWLKLKKGCREIFLA